MPSNLNRLSTLQGAVQLGYTSPDNHTTTRSRVNCSYWSPVGLLCVSAGILISGWDFVTEGLCRTAIDLCLVFYVGDKVFSFSGGLPAFFFDSEEEPLFIGGRSIFAPCVGGGAPRCLCLFLVERTHQTRGPSCARYQDPTFFLSVVIVSGGFGIIAVFAFLYPVTSLSLPLLPLPGRRATLSHSGDETSNLSYATHNASMDIHDAITRALDPEFSYSSALLTNSSSPVCTIPLQDAVAIIPVMGLSRQCTRIISHLENCPWTATPSNVARPHRLVANRSLASY